MPSKKLIALLRTFSSSEWNRFKKYLASPYFNESEELQQLFAQVEPVIRTSVEPKNSLTAKQHIWQQIFKNTPYDDAYMRRLLSELIQKTLAFQALEQYQKNPVEEQIHLLKMLNKPEMHLHFNGILRQIELLQKKSGLQDANYHFWQYLIENQQYKFIEKNTRTPEMFQNLQAADFHLECYYISQKLKHYADFLGYQNFLRSEIPLHLSDTFLEFVQTGTFLEEPSVAVYFLIVKMFLEPDTENYYFQVKALLKEKGHLFHSLELKEIYTHLLNYCIDIKINAGVRTYFNELFSLYQILIDRDLLWENNYFSAPNYKNIITIGLLVKAFAWTEAFIQNYTPKLPPEERENALTYNLAKVYFAQNQYEKVIEQLREVEYDNLTYALGGKLMLLKTYYELNEYLALDSLIDSFRVYLRRNQTISKEVRQQYLNVLRFIKKLSNIHSGDQVAITKVEQQIQECKNLADKGWIVSKVEELKGNKGIGE